MRSGLDWVSHGVAMLAEAYAKAGVPEYAFKELMTELELVGVRYVAAQARQTELALRAARVTELAKAHGVTRNTIYARRERAQNVQKMARIG